MHVSHDDIIKSLSIDEYMKQLQYMKKMLQLTIINYNQILCCTILTSMN